MEFAQVIINYWMQQRNKSKERKTCITKFTLKSLEVDGTNIKSYKRMELRLSAIINYEIAFIFNTTNFSSIFNQILIKISIKSDIISIVKVSYDLTEPIIMHIKTLEKPEFLKKPNSYPLVSPWTPMTGEESIGGFTAPTSSVQVIKAVIKLTPNNDEIFDRYKRLRELLKEIVPKQKLFYVDNFEDNNDEDDIEKNILFDNILLSIEENDELNKYALNPEEFDNSNKIKITIVNKEALNNDIEDIEEDKKPVNTNINIEGSTKNKSRKMFKEDIKESYSKIPNDFNEIGNMLYSICKQYMSLSNTNFDIERDKPIINDPNVEVDSLQSRGVLIHDKLADNSVTHEEDTTPEEIDVLKMTNTLQNQVLKYKKIPIRKPGTLCCPEYECWESFETLESLKQHIILTHGILALSRLRPKSDRTFDPSDDLIKSAYGYSESHPGEIEKVINDIENKLNLK